LASNSLTEGVVAGTQVGRDLAWELPELVEPDEIDADSASTPTGLLGEDLRTQVRSTMSRHVGVSRRPEGLDAAKVALAQIASTVNGDVIPHRRAFEATNLLTIATAVVEAASARTESRGCHRRRDYPEPRAVWLRHLTERLDTSGAPRVHGSPEGA
jgi:L-aspartate oxidase